MRNVKMIGFLACPAMAELPGGWFPAAHARAV